MFAAYRTAASTYRNLAVETSLTEADPHRMIAMLYDGAIDAISRARNALARRDVPARCAAVTHAIRIVNEGLIGSLDDREGDIAHKLHALYTYITPRLLEANANADDIALEEAAGLLDKLRDAWRGIAPAR
jgi:flagellar protein FliS